MEKKDAGTLAKRRFVVDLGVGGPAQDVIDKLEKAESYTDLVIKAVREYRKEDSE